ncbi:hypothetical protein GGI07_001799 [Coemansia sp. Benny D115]|nr:hypothetical protein GGI07_001799 [Coemansia sp. Benny D115]
MTTTSQDPSQTLDTVHGSPIANTQASSQTSDTATGKTSARLGGQGNNSRTSMSDASIPVKSYDAAFGSTLTHTPGPSDNMTPDARSARPFQWKQLLDPEFYPEITIRRSVFFFIWTIPHIIITAYRGADKKRDISRRMNNASMACILFDLAAILVFMSPTFLGLLRYTFLPRFITFEKNIHAHKVASYTMLFWSAIHIGVPLLHNMFEIKTGWTGHILTFALFLIVVTSIKPIRKRFFEAFYYVHHLFIVYVAVMYIHHRAYMTKKYVSGPLALYCVDRIYRSLRSAFAKSPVRAVIQHPSGMVEVQLDKKIFGHRAGQFVKVYCPSVSLFQWHPMTISSAPEEELLSIHFRLNGRWTQRLAKRLGCQFDSADGRESTIQQLVASKIGTDAVFFGKHRQRNGGEPAKRSAIPYHPLHQDPTTAPMYSHAGRNSSYVSIDMMTKGTNAAVRNQVISAAQGGEDDNDNKIKPVVSVHGADYANKSAGQLEGGNMVIKMGKDMPLIFIDGPYSAPTEHFFEYEVGILMAAGIGVTPSAAVLRSMYFKSLEFAEKMTTKKVYLFWVFREIKTLEWFKDLLVALDEEGLSNVVEVRTYYTGSLPNNCVRLPAKAGDKYGDQIIKTSNGFVTYIGRPDFSDIYDSVGANHPNTRIGTFFCGPKPMARKARREAHKWDRTLRKRSSTKLDFHSEVFF